MKKLEQVQLNEQTVKRICDILAHTYNGLTESEIRDTLHSCHMTEIDKGNRNINNGMYYVFGQNKRTWLYNCFAHDVNRHHNYKNIFRFIESAMSPLNYTPDEKRARYQWLSDELNKVLLLIGLRISNNGKIEQTVKATTLDEMDRRVDNFKRKLYSRAIHVEIEKYCRADFLQKDYFSVVFEASKGLAERVRQITGLTGDGGKLFQTAFSKNEPCLFFNSLKTESELNEFMGLKELLQAIFHLVRNPAAHTPKINWKVDETKALDILTVISFAHKYLDECHKIPGGHKG